MAASVRNVARNFSRIQLVELCLRQSTRSISSKATGASKATATSSKKTPTKAPKEPTPGPVDAKPAAVDATPYVYEVPQYDDLLFYTVESDMVKYRIPQPSPGKP